MSDSDYKYFTFNDILKATFVELSNKKFIILDTNETLGFIWAKYNEKTNLDSIGNGGIIEFISKDGGQINKIYGKNFDRNKITFKAIITNL